MKFGGDESTVWASKDNKDKEFALEQKYRHKRNGYGETLTVNVNKGYYNVDETLDKIEDVINNIDRYDCSILLTKNESSYIINKIKSTKMEYLFEDEYANSIGISFNFNSGALMNISIDSVMTM